MRFLALLYLCSERADGGRSARGEQGGRRIPGLSGYRGTATGTTSPRFTSSHSSRKRLHSRHPCRHSRDVAPSALLVGTNLLEASGRADRGTQPCAAGECETVSLSFWGAWTSVQGTILCGRVHARLSIESHHASQPHTNHCLRVVLQSAGTKGR